MAYAKLREAVLDAGWLPLRDTQCWENVGGEAAVCDALPETASCSGDGHCLLWFAAADGRRLRVDAYGPFERWNAKGEEAAFAVRGWELHPAPVAPATACPSADDFDAFLSGFAADPAAERAYTAPVVKVAELYADDRGDHSRIVYVEAGEYRDFNLDHVDGSYRFVDAEGKVDTDPLPLQISTEAGGARTVRYQYGMSEGNSYRFERRSNCWYLTQDPEPPAP